MSSKYRTTVMEQTSPRVSWGAIFAGVVVALAVQVLFMTLGAGIGFSAFDPQEGDALSGGSLVRAGIFTGVASLISLFVGGFVAGRLAGSPSPQIGSLHGVATWAVVSGLTVYLVSSGMMGAIRLTGQAVGAAAKTAVSALPSANVDVNGASLVEEAKQILRETGKAELDPNRLANEAKSLPAAAAKRQANDPSGRRAEALVEGKLDEKVAALDQDAIANVLAKRLGISKSQANSLIGQSEDAAQDVVAAAGQQWQTVKAKAKETAQAGTDVAANVSWGAFFSLALGMIAALGGGMVGSRLIPRDEYEESFVERRAA